jgi:hypothetical protein
VDTTLSRAIVTQQDVHAPIFIVDDSKEDLSLLERVRTFLIKPVTVEDIIQLLSGLTRIQITDLADGYLLEHLVGTQTTRDTTFFRRKGLAFPA